MFKMNLGKTNLVELQIITPDKVSIAFKTRRVLIGLEDKVDNMIDELRKTGVLGIFQLWYSKRKTEIIECA